MATFIGYEKKIVPNLSVTKEKNELTFGIIELEQNALLMKEIQTIGQKEMEKFRIDKKVINVSQNSNAPSGTALDVLQTQQSIIKEANAHLIK